MQLYSRTLSFHQASLDVPLELPKKVETQSVSSWILLTSTWLKVRLTAWPIAMPSLLLTRSPLSSASQPASRRRSWNKFATREHSSESTLRSSQRIDACVDRQRRLKLQVVRSLASETLQLGLIVSGYLSLQVCLFLTNFSRYCYVQRFETLAIIAGSTTSTLLRFSDLLHSRASISFVSSSFPSSNTVFQFSWVKHARLRMCIKYKVYPDSSSI